MFNREAESEIERLASIAEMDWSVAEFADTLRAAMEWAYRDSIKACAASLRHELTTNEFDAGHNRAIATCLEIIESRLTETPK